VTDRDRIAALLLAHRALAGYGRVSCKCGWSGQAYGHAVHVTDCLIAAGVTMPEPSAFCGPGCFSRPCPNCPEGEK
jgi:hypothetical protein